jgi:hypothetical protein
LITTSLTVPRPRALYIVFAGLLKTAVDLKKGGAEMKIIFAIFIILHGLVHMWYFTLSRRLVDFKPEMGWTGESWLLTNVIGDSATRSIASVVYIIATIALVIGGISLLSGAHWWRPFVGAAAGFSAASILIFWDVSTQLLVQRGLLGFLINLAILFLILVVRWPVAE